MLRPEDWILREGIPPSESFRLGISKRRGPRGNLTRNAGDRSYYDFQEGGFFKLARLLKKSGFLNANDSGIISRKLEELANDGGRQGDQFLFYNRAWHNWAKLHVANGTTPPLLPARNFEG